MCVRSPTRLTVCLSSFLGTSSTQKSQFRCHTHTHRTYNTLRLNPIAIESIKRNIIKTMARNAHLSATATGPASTRSVRKYFVVVACDHTRHERPRWRCHRCLPASDDDDNIPRAYRTDPSSVCAGWLAAGLDRILARQMECEKQFKSNASGCEFCVYAFATCASLSLCNNNNCRSHCVMCMLWPSRVPVWGKSKRHHRQTQAQSVRESRSDVGCCCWYRVHATRRTPVAKIFNFQWAELAKNLSVRLRAPHIAHIVASPIRSSRSSVFSVDFVLRELLFFASLQCRQRNVLCVSLVSGNG